MIGVAYSTRNRREIAEKNINQCRHFLPKDSIFVIVDDASYISYPGADFRFNENVGVAVVKNKCLEFLEGCEHIFLFDDDCSPKVKDWHLPYINSGIPHLSFTWNHFRNGMRGSKILIGNSEIKVYQNPMGCMLYFHRSSIDKVGGFDTDYKQYGFEHADLSRRIHNAGLTPYKYIDIVGSENLFHSEDYNCAVVSTVPNGQRIYREHNKKIFDQNIASKEYKPYL